MAGINDKMAAIEAAALAQTTDVQDEVLEARLDEEQLREMTVKDLKAMAADMDLTYDKNAKKEDLVALIAAEIVQIPPEAVIQKVEDGDNAEAVATDGEDLTQEDKELPGVEIVEGCVMVCYNGMVNLRDGDLNVVGNAMQGQTFPVTARVTDETGTWYVVEDQDGRAYMISAEVVRFMGEQ